MASGIIDLAVLAPLVSLPFVVFFVYWTVEASTGPSYYEEFSQVGVDADPGPSVASFFAFAFLMFATWFGSILLEAYVVGKTGRFLGGRVTRVHLVSIDTGGPAGMGRCVVRTFLLYLFYVIDTPLQLLSIRDEWLADRLMRTRTVKLLTPYAALPLGPLQPRRGPFIRFRPHLPDDWTDHR